MVGEELAPSIPKTDVVSLIYLMVVIKLHKKFSDSDKEPAE